MCVCVRYLEQAMLVTVLAQPHSTAQGELHLRGVYHPLINPANDKSGENVYDNDTEPNICHFFVPGLSWQEC